MKQSNNQSRFVEKVELELLSALIHYVVPFVDKKINTQSEKQSGLENIISSQKFGINDFRKLETLLLENISMAKAEKKACVNSKEMFYSLIFRRQKSKDGKSGKYSASIKYEENQHQSRLRISVNKDKKEVYSSEIIDRKDEKNKTAPYGIIINYEENYAEERLSISYRQQLRGYMQQHIADKEDMANRVPLKWLNILPETMMGGVLGFTYLGENFMGRRADLTGKTARMVDIHESIHTPDEYETRVLTSWIMEKVKGKYVK